MEIDLKSYLNVAHEPANYVMPQSHSCYEMVLYLSGEGKTVIGEELYDFRPMDLAIITPQTVHDELSLTATEVCCCLFTYQGALPLDNGVYHLWKPSAQQAGIEIDRLMRWIQNEMYGKKLEYETCLNYIMGQILIIFFRTQSAVRSVSDGMSYVKTYVKENYSRHIDFHILANHIGYSYYRFRHIFKELEGISPSRYLLNVRIRRAKEFLTQTDYPIERVARLVGFGGASRFIETFKAETKETPSRYRDMLQARGVEEINFESKPLVN